jgi:Tfp pilus assembly protein PilN
MVYLEERVQELEDHSRQQDELIDKLLRMIDKNNQSELLSMEQAYIKLTGNKHVTPSAHSQYMNSLVKRGLIHKVLIGGRPKFDPKELDELIESRKITGRVI